MTSEPKTSDLQKVLLILGIVLFIIIGVGTLILLFGSLVFFGDKVAVVDMDGEIGGDSLFGGGVSTSAMREILEDVGDDPRIVAVVLQINSGGGGVVESKEISRYVSKLAQKKPVVAYIGDVGASGAYYVATFAEAIVADEDALIGNVGVISTYNVYKTLFEEKLGINTTVIKSGEFKDIGSPYREMTDQERARLQEMIDKIHAELLYDISVNRRLAESSIEAIRSGTIFLGSEGVALGLVDLNGGLDDAIDLAAKYAKSKNFDVEFIDESAYYGSDAFYNLGRGLGDSLASILDSPGSSNALRLAAK